MSYKGMQHGGFDMSNFDHEIDEGMQKHLMSNEGLEYCNHCAMDFCGYVYYQDGVFIEDVFRYGAHIDTITANSLDDLMEKVNNEYGWD